MIYTWVGSVQAVTSRNLLKRCHIPNNTCGFIKGLLSLVSCAVTIFLTNDNTDKDLVSCVGWTTADELYSSGYVCYICFTSTDLSQYVPWSVR